MKSIDDFDFNNKRALIRVDFNVPLNDQHEITDLTRMQAAIPTLKKIISDGGSCVLMSHLGRPKSGPENKFSLKHLVNALNELTGVPVHFSEDSVGQIPQTHLDSLNPGEILLLENLRFHPEETQGDPDYAKQLSELGDIFVNDAFGTAHRAHASTTIVAQYFENKCAGYVLLAEVENAAKVMRQPQRPYTAIMGGAKISDKILIIEKLLDKVDNLLIGGGMSYTFFKALGGNIGTSLVEEDKLDIARDIIKMAKEKNVNLELPKDSLAATSFSNDAESEVVQNINIPGHLMGLDIGPEARVVFDRVIQSSKTILWNGPMGVFEFSNFAEGTKAVANSVVQSTSNGAFSLIGGGDSAAAVNSLGLGDRVSYVSTGGGALLELMEGKILPGIAALNDN